MTNTKSKIFPLRVGSLTSWNRKVSCVISDKKVALGESTEAQSVFQSNSGILKSPTRTIFGFCNEESTVSRAVCRPNRQLMLLLGGLWKTPKQIFLFAGNIISSNNNSESKLTSLTDARNVSRTAIKIRTPRRPF